MFLLADVPDLMVQKTRERPQPETVTLRCVGGHDFEWTFTNRGGARPKWCAAHKLYRDQIPPARLLPPKTVLQEWHEQAKVLDDDEYAERWTREWINTVRILAARCSGWGPIDPDPVEKYVRARRLAELHRLYAQDQPYTNFRGSVKPHPGWALSEREEEKAEKIALRLGLIDVSDLEVNPPTPNPSPGRGNGNGKHVTPYKTRLQQSAAEQEDIQAAVGPDGESL